MRHAKRNGTLAIVTLAALAGLAAGAVAVYVSNTSSGNSIEAAGTAETGGACAARAEFAAKVGEAARGEVAAMMAAEPVSLASLAFRGADGAPLTLADFGGKTVLLNLWATWCAPCRAEMPALDRLQQARGGDDFEVVAVNVEKGGDEKPRGFLAEIGVEALAFYRDESLALFNDLRARSLALGLPVTLLIDGEGCLIAAMNGPAHWDSPDALRLIDTALQRS